MQDVMYKLDDIYNDRNSMTAGRTPNKLINEKSPYLMRHVNDAVEWYPWGDEAFFVAREENKPIFLSIGYSTCHWGTITEKTYFNDTAIAELLNEAFVNVKIDKDEYPDVSGIYFEMSQAMTAGTSEWPLNMFLTPNLIPFFAFTQNAIESGIGARTFPEFIADAIKLWDSPEKEIVVEQSEAILYAIATTVRTGGDTLPDKGVIEEAAEQIIQLADPVFGGIKGLPKSPIGYQANLMLRVGEHYGEGRAIFYADTTLDVMRRSGVYDNIAGGFSCATIDEQWRIPHFEKMLYDNANAISAYLEAWKATEKEEYRDVCNKTIDFILEEMTNDNGTFFSSCDADAEGREGQYYTWTPQEIIDAIGHKRAKTFCKYYNITDKGDFNGRSTLYAQLSEEEYADKHKINKEELVDTLNASYPLLKKARKCRLQPNKDDKVLTSWNALMIHSIAEAGFALENDAYLDAAEKAARFIQKNMQEAGHLLRRWRDDEAKYFGILNDYAYMIRAAITLFESDRGTQWLEWARHMTNILSREFRTGNGSYYVTDGLDPAIILQRCQYIDLAEPSGNAVHTENLLRLYKITNDPIYFVHAEGIMRGAETPMKQYPIGHCYHLLALMRYYDKKAQTIIIALDKKDTMKKEIQHLLGQQYHPHTTVIWKRDNDALLHDTRITKNFPELSTYNTINKKTSVYISQDEQFSQPLTTIESVTEALH
ncbi:MAG: thioredoxin domain-containing protein [Waddliaceae bacterium]|jgi:uncharacterized protein|nr:thioredoxin domain-containing protein [Waddliaceae bacterium]